ncbi:hypothetical protein LINPERHAP2_LOCUS3439 [Linum perenne]
MDKCDRKIGYPPGYHNKGIFVAVNAVQVVQVDDIAGVGQEKDSRSVTISQQQYQTLYSLFQGHSSAASVLGQAHGGMVSCVTKNHAKGSTGK